MVGCISVAIGVIGISVALQEYSRVWSPSPRIIVGEIAYCSLVIAAGISLLLDVVWARPAALAVWGSWMAELLHATYWYGSSWFGNSQSLFYFPELLPRLGFHIVSIVLGPWLIVKLFARPTPKGSRPRVLWATFLGGFLLSAIGNLWLFRSLR
jgi:hypothetical protein